MQNAMTTRSVSPASPQQQEPVKEEDTWWSTARPPGASAERLQQLWVDLCTSCSIPAPVIRDWWAVHLATRQHREYRSIDRLSILMAHFAGAVEEISLTDEEKARRREHRARQDDGYDRRGAMAGTTTSKLHGASTTTSRSGAVLPSLSSPSQRMGTGDFSGSFTRTAARFDTALEASTQVYRSPKNGESGPLSQTLRQSSSSPRGGGGSRRGNDSKGKGARRRDGHSRDSVAVLNVFTAPSCRRFAAIVRPVAWTLFFHDFCPSACTSEIAVKSTTDTWLDFCNDVQCEDGIIDTAEISKVKLLLSSAASDGQSAAVPLPSDLPQQTLEASLGGDRDSKFLNDNSDAGSDRSGSSSRHSSSAALRSTQTRSWNPNQSSTSYHPPRSVSKGSAHFTALDDKLDSMAPHRQRQGRWNNRAAQHQTASHVDPRTPTRRDPAAVRGSVFVPSAALLFDQPSAGPSGLPTELPPLSSPTANSSSKLQQEATPVRDNERSHDSDPQQGASTTELTSAVGLLDGVSADDLRLSCEDTLPQQSESLVLVRFLRDVLLSPFTLPRASYAAFVAAAQREVTSAAPPLLLAEDPSRLLHHGKKENNLEHETAAVYQKIQRTLVRLERQRAMDATEAGNTTSAVGDSLSPAGGLVTSNTLNGPHPHQTHAEHQQATLVGLATTTTSTTPVMDGTGTVDSTGLRGVHFNPSDKAKSHTATFGDTNSGAKEHIDATPPKPYLAALGYHVDVSVAHTLTKAAAAIKKGKGEGGKGSKRRARRESSSALVSPAQSPAQGAVGRGRKRSGAPSPSPLTLPQPQQTDAGRGGPKRSGAGLPPTSPLQPSDRTANRASASGLAQSASAGLFSDQKSPSAHPLLRSPQASFALPTALLRSPTSPGFTGQGGARALSLDSIINGSGANGTAVMAPHITFSTYALLNQPGGVAHPNGLSTPSASPSMLPIGGLGGIGGGTGTQTTLPLLGTVASMGSFASISLSHPATPPVKPSRLLTFQDPTQPSSAFAPETAGLPKDTFVKHRRMFLERVLALAAPASRGVDLAGTINSRTFGGRSGMMGGGAGSSATMYPQHSITSNPQTGSGGSLLPSLNSTQRSPNGPGQTLSGAGGPSSSLAAATSLGQFMRGAPNGDGQAGHSNSDFSPTFDRSYGGGASFGGMNASSAGFSASRGPGARAMEMSMVRQTPMMAVVENAPQQLFTFGYVSDNDHSVLVQKRKVELAQRAAARRSILESKSRKQKEISKTTPRRDKEKDRSGLDMSCTLGRTHRLNAGGQRERLLSLAPDIEDFESSHDGLSSLGTTQRTGPASPLSPHHGPSAASSRGNHQSGRTGGKLESSVEVSSVDRAKRFEKAAKAEAQETAATAQDRLETGAQLLAALATISKAVPWGRETGALRVVDNVKWELRVLDSSPRQLSPLGIGDAKAVIALEKQRHDCGKLLPDEAKLLLAMNPNCLCAGFFESSKDASPPLAAKGARGKKPSMSSSMSRSMGLSGAFSSMTTPPLSPQQRLRAGGRGMSPTSSVRGNFSYGGASSRLKEGELIGMVLASLIPLDTSAPIPRPDPESELLGKIERGGMRGAPGFIDYSKTDDPFGINTLGGGGGGGLMATAALTWNDAGDATLRGPDIASIEPRKRSLGDDDFSGDDEKSMLAETAGGSHPMMGSPTSPTAPESPPILDLGSGGKNGGGVNSKSAAGDVGPPPRLGLLDSRRSSLALDHTRTHHDIAVDGVLLGATSRGADPNRRTVYDPESKHDPTLGACHLVIHSFTVHHTQRCHGVGRMLLEQFIDEARRQNPQITRCSFFAPLFMASTLRRNLNFTVQGLVPAAVSADMARHQTEALHYGRGVGLSPGVSPKAGGGGGGAVTPSRSPRHIGEQDGFVVPTPAARWGKVRDQGGTGGAPLSSKAGGSNAFTDVVASAMAREVKPPMATTPGARSNVSPRHGTQPAHGGVLVEVTQCFDTVRK